MKLSSAIVKLNDIGIMILLDVFSSPIAFGAQTFLTIVCVLAGLGAGISAIDVRSTFSKKK